MPQIVDLSGRQFGRLTVESLVPRSEWRNGCACWECVCKCGTRRIVRSNSLINGNTTSCGCYHREQLSQRATTHGGLKIPGYFSWAKAKRRCTTPTNPDYPNYGGRGIKMCDRWLNDFAAFLADMGPRPSSAHTLDRIDVNRDYEPGNCRWAVSAVQSRNTRRNVRVIYDGKLMCLTDAATLAGLCVGTVEWRRRSGWPESKWFVPSTRSHAA